MLHVRARVRIYLCADVYIYRHICINASIHVCIHNGAPFLNVDIVMLVTLADCLQYNVALSTLQL